jgi:hypothetical protein
VTGLDNEMVRERIVDERADRGPNGATLIDTLPGSAGFAGVSGQSQFSAATW